ncbi:MAG: uridine diphosphate-N-acetylglucosamine-binding protein YvcK [Actinomycetota bacterium]
MTPHQRVVALGGGHGLSVTLKALRALGAEPVAIAGTGDDGGSSGRLREHLGVPPPGDLRMALAALADEGLWLRVLQHRFGGTGDVEGHALGNLILVALWEETGDIVAGLDRLGAVLGVRGRVLPNCLDPVEVVADVIDDDGTVREVRGQARLSAGAGRITALRLSPQQPRACPEAVAAIREASHVVIGPGSWFTSILPHALVPEIASALRQTSARKILVLNAAPQAGETDGYLPGSYLASWAEYAPDVRLDDVIVASEAVADSEPLGDIVAGLGASLHVANVLAGPGHHDPALLANALSGLGVLGGFSALGGFRD